MTRWSAADCRPVGARFFRAPLRSALKTRFTASPLMSDHQRIAACGPPFGLEDRNDRKFGDAGGL